MRLTDYHAKFIAYELTRRCPSDSTEKLAGALVDAQVDLNPHQVEAALFAFKSPLSRGALLADEVGLGKTIEAGLVISQRWAERRRKILVITPANLRKQWHQELTEKFFLTCEILESKSYNEAVKKARFRPFETNAVVICSYQFAKSKASDVSGTPWDLVVIDEAHRLRNVYKPSNVIANVLKTALQSAPKLLLTATPLQNSLLELFGLVSVIDEYAFGDVASFRDQFAQLRDRQVFQELKARLKPLCHRTLRRQVQAFVQFTKRHPIVQPFSPDDSEDRLYHLVSDYLQRENLQALPKSQRSLMTLVLRKLLASSTFAIAGALETIANRLRAQIEKALPSAPLEEGLGLDYEALEQTAEEWPEGEEPPAALTEVERMAIEQEISDLDGFRALAVSIPQNAKGRALLTALDLAFAEATRLGAAQKAIIFTESRRTQDYLLRVLADSAHAEGIVLFNGSNTDPKSREIYVRWLDRHRGTDRITGSRTADMRSALVDYFREEGRIMIATEAGAEGINLQFCALVVNFDLPWNPQRIEQRIGRCHRYGQKHDVVVVNFLNQKNEADQRVFKLLSEKFSLFQGVFGASDEVLGAIESGVDFEKRIADIYQRCRTSEEIRASFDQLQSELSTEISEAMSQTRRQLLENFDEEVHEKLRVSLREGQEYRTRFERLLLDLTEFELGDHAEFKSDNSGFLLRSHPFPDASSEIPLGLYELPRRTGEAHLYRLAHPLAERLLVQAKAKTVPPASLTFDYDNYGVQISALQPYCGRRGYLEATIVTVESLDQAEDYLIVAAVTDDGSAVEADAARRILSLPASEVRLLDASPDSEQLRGFVALRRGEIQRTISERNGAFFEAEADKLEAWADDQKVALERAIKDLDRRIKEARRASTAGGSLEEKLRGQKVVKSLESERREARRKLFDAQDAIEAKRDELIAGIERKLQQRVTEESLFQIEWKIA